MIYGLHISALAAVMENNRVGVIAHNLANVETPGYRRDVMTFQERLTEVLEGQHSRKYLNPKIDRHGGAPLIEEVVFDRQAGPIDRTGENWDVALEGEGFFMVRDLSTGRDYYTRNGNFTLDRSGRLTTQDGKYAVLNVGGEPIAVDPGVQGFVSLDAGGTLYAGEAALGRIGVARFDDLRSLEKVGDTLFENRGAPPQPAGEARIVQGALEGSTVNPITELAAMIESQRLLETHMKMITIQDATLERTVNDLGRPTR